MVTFPVDAPWHPGRRRIYIPITPFEVRRIKRVSIDINAFPEQAARHRP